MKAPHQAFKCYIGGDVPRCGALGLISSQTLRWTLSYYVLSFQQLQSVALFPHVLTSVMHCILFLKHTQELSTEMF